MIEQLNDLQAYFFAFALFHFSHASKTDFCGLFALMIPQRFGDTITGFAYATQDTWRDPHPLDRRSYAVVVWLPLNV